MTFRFFWGGIWYFFLNLIWGYIGILGETPDKRISEGFFDLFFFVFIGIIGGTPDKRIYEDLF